MMARRSSRIVCRFALSIMLLPALTACGDGGVQEIKQWMDEIKQQTKTAIPKLAEPKKFTPFVYSSKDNLDPFNPAKLAAAFAKLAANPSNKLKPNLDRRREPLESYPLDAIKMVGTLEKPGLGYAILQVDKMVFQAKVGNYLGQNLGMITRITETAVEITEVVQDAAGDWVERQAKLELQEIKNDGANKTK